MINEKTILLLVDSFKNDADILSLIGDCYESFENYHAAVYKQETYKLLNSSVKNGEIHRDTLTELDRRRTICHNAVIANVGILNRLAEMQSLPPVYDGIVSEERPHRRNIANAVFDYVEGIIKKRD
jgi:hypothetical protein